MSKFRIIVVLLLCEALQSFGQTTVTFDFTEKKFVESTLNASTSIYGKTDVIGSFTYNNIKFDNAVIKHYEGKDQYWLSIQKGVETAISSLTDKNIISIKFYISGSSTSYFAQLRINGESITHNNGFAEWSGTANSITATSVQIPIPIDKIEVTYESTVSLPTISIDGNNENTSNSPIIETNSGKTVDVVLNRSFEGNNGWYTLCLPFDLTKAQLNTAFGDRVDVETMSDVVKGNDGMLSVNFSKSTDGISGGKPYLIKPSKNVDNPKFTSVTINAKSPIEQKIGDYYEFIGIYDPTAIPVDSKYHFLNSEGSYLVSSTGIGKLKATRAYFILPTSNSAKVMTGQEETTGIGSIKTSTNEDVIYNMNGQRVNSNLVSGIYIINGKKVAIRK
jgi:hypothetical protein